MKIGIYDPYLDDLGGGEKYMMTLAECLSSKHDVTVFWDSRDDINKLQKRFSLNLSNITLNKNIFSRNVNFFERVIQTRNLDALIILSDGSIPFSLSKKLYIHIQQPLQNVKLNFIKDRFKFSRITKIFCNSYFTKSFIDKEYGINSEVLYPPVDIKVKKEKKENIILHVGRFRVVNVKNEDYKKQQIMVDTFKQMVKDGLKDWKFVVATSIHNEEDSEFKKLLSSSKNFPIEFLINKRNEELWEIYGKAKIYWHASGFGEDLDERPEYAEHFGISTVEAMGAGVVPVVINAGGQREIVKDGENGFLWDNLSELKAQTLKLIKEKDLLEKLSLKAKASVGQFNKERFCQGIEKIIQ